MREVRGDGVANSAGPGEALANRRYGIKGGVSVGGSRTGIGSVEERRPRPFPSSSKQLGNAGIPVSEKNSSRKLAEQARSHTPRYRISMRVYGYGFPKMSLLGSSVNRGRVPCLYCKRRIS